ncbi:hypothetical protein CASFOL_010876 [Castilleja foliolosa]|uniref:GST N-terminal domain-containing protein n=1 Tax=Castilleja foliolosa TaxID=1961234 RepID=A0ABD3DTV8_9LAMI
MDLKVYVNPFSQPSRAILIFCKANGIAFKDVAIKLDLEINPMKQIPVIEHGDFKLSKTIHSILIYLASAFPRVANHWYPTDACKRATIHSMLHWHQSNLRRGSVEYLLNGGVAIAFGLPMDPNAAFQGKKLFVGISSDDRFVLASGKWSFLTRKHSTFHC